MNGTYKLDKNNVAVPCDDIEEWARWFGTAARRVAEDDVGSIRISTVFLGIDHSLFEGPPLLFETMIFGGAHNEHQARCSTWDQAVAQHAEAVAMARSELN